MMMNITKPMMRSNWRTMKANDRRKTINRENDESSSVNDVTTANNYENTDANENPKR